VTDGSFAQGLIGVTLDGRYRLDAVLGEGGMGSVFRATQLAMDRKVAVKLLKPHLTSDAAALQRFAREANATLKVDSPHAVKILDFGVTPLGDYYMVLEYLDGRTVQRELEVDGVFAPRRVAHVARQALDALGAAHAQGLIHRDVKPDNLLLMRVGSDPDYAKVLDFGVAKLMQGATDPGQLALTGVGMVFGTPEFMSPEQACGQALDGRSDLYSLAATMFVMLTGTPLFEARTAIESLTHHARTPPPHLAMLDPELAAYPELDAVLQRCLAKRRELRPATAAEMAALIAGLEPTLSRPAAAPHGGAAEPPPPRPPSRPFHASSYFHVVESSAAVPSERPTPDLGVSRGRGRYFVLGGAALAALVGLAVGLVIHGPAARTGASPADSPVALASGDAGPPDAGAALAPDGSIAAPRDAAVRAVPLDAASPTVRAPPRNPVADEHLRNAEDALRAGAQLKQLTEADLALRADPRNVRARYLLGDALIKSGDLERGCNSLRALTRYPLAQQRRRTAGCPGD
jgi:serine/threonine protein kinase